MAMKASAQTDLSTNPFLRWFRWLGVPVVGLVLYGLSYVINPQLFAAPYYDQLGWKAYLCDLVFVLGGSYALFESSVWITRALDRYLAWSDYPLARLLVQSLLMIGLGLVLTLAFLYLIAYLTIPEDYTITPEDELGMRQTIVLGIVMAICTNAIYTGEFFFRRWKNALLEAEALKRESVEARFAALKSQLDPHFLFNNLNTLTYLVDDNPVAVRFVENLSLVYRYILQNRDKTLVPLADELKLAEAYLYLLKNRFGEGIQVAIDVPKDDRSRLIPPMTLQLLIENAVKHNVVDESRPLQIRLSCSPSGELLVENSLHRRQSVEGKTGIGLRNIRHRYDLLNVGPPAVRDDGAVFAVRLPLVSL